ncbi:MAG: hypothetical protein SF051_14625 [Elusimicrobiota bacterium]|nr:hypothetical protein [Elusimicrobiota bacterium]
MRLALLLVLAASTASAAPSLRLSGGPKAEDKLRRFVSGDKALRERLADISAREAAFRAEARESDLRDAVSDAPVDRAELIAQLPGLRRPSVPSCPTLKDCPAPELAADVADAADLAEAVRALVRPWMLLQQARGSVAEVSSAQGGDALLTVRLKDLDADPLVLNATPRLLGGFKVWFDRPLLLAALYGREREAALR